MHTEKIQLEDDEVILAQVRKHWFILAMQVVSILIGGAFPLVFIFVATQFGETELFTIAFQSIPLVTALYAIWLLLMWMALFSIWTNYYLDVWTITNKRLIAIDQKGLFHRTTGSFRLERLQDLNVAINGIIPTLLDYGTLQAQTAAGSEDEFHAYGLPHPRELKSLILSASDKLMNQYSENPSNRSGV